MTFSVEVCIGQIVKDLISTPDHSALMEDINENHKNDFVLLKHELAEDGFQELPQYYKVLFTNSVSIIVEQLEMMAGWTRFRVRQIDAGKWPEMFVSWLTPEDSEYEWLGQMSWCDGINMYGGSNG